MGGKENWNDLKLNLRNLATPKRINKVRDSDATKRALLKAIGEILCEQGFSALKTNLISRWIGKDKNLIRYHFNGLANLKKAYIAEKDYWPPFFEKFRLSPDSGPDEIRTMFIKLMQENFYLFENNPEMQKIVLWQISEENPLMRGISEDREAEGEKLLKLSDPAFQNTGINFRAVAGLLLGGIYYMVLHSKTNKSKVCGVDINMKRDREEVIRTIEQIISWSWNMAQENKNSEIQSTKTMNYEFELLENFASRLKERYTQGDKQESHFILENEIKRLKKVMLQHLLTLTNETQIKTYLQINLHTLVNICNSLYHPGHSNPEAMMLLDLMVTVTKPVAEQVPGNIPLPHLFSDDHAQKFDRQSLQITAQLEQAGIDPFLIEILSYPFKRFTGQKEMMKWDDYEYLKKYTSAIEDLISETSFTQADLINMLIALGYNHTRFTAYYSWQLKESLQMRNEEERKGNLNMAKTQILQVTIIKGMIFDHSKLPVKEELIKWIDAEYYCQSATPTELLVNPKKLNTKLKIVQLAFWAKLQSDHGIYDEVNLDVLSEKIAYNFSSKGQDELSASSIKSKFYPKDHSTLASIEKILVRMLEDVRQFLR